MLIGQVNVLPALVMVWVVPPEKVKVLELRYDVPGPAIQFPYTVTEPPPNEKNIAFVLADISTVPVYGMRLEREIELDRLSPVLLIIAVSCGKGKLIVFTAPPGDVAHALDVQPPPGAKFQYTVLGVSNVMPRHSPLLPMRVPLMGAAVPRTYKPRKSASVRLGALFTTRSYEVP